jgi:hypothetical protein
MHVADISKEAEEAIGEIAQDEAIAQAVDAEFGTEWAETTISVSKNKDKRRKKHVFAWKILRNLYNRIGSDLYECTGAILYKRLMCCARRYAIMRGLPAQ